MYYHLVSLPVVFTRMNEWLLFNANSAIVQLFHGKDKLILNEMMMKSALF